MIKKENKTNYTIADIGKIPPQAIELEEAILGSIMIDSMAIYKINHIISPSCFYRDANQKIFIAILELIKLNQIPDILTVTDKLRSLQYLDEVGGPYYISQLTEKVSSAYNIELHAKIVKQKYLAREFIRYAGDLQGMSFDEGLDISDLMDFAQNGLFDIISNTITKEAVRVSETINEQIILLEKILKKEVELSGIPSGFVKLDRLTGGWQQPDLIILAARPSQGKTALSIYFSKFPSELKKPVAYFSLEMSKEQIARRIISYETKIDSMDLNKGRVSNNEFKSLEKVLGKFEKLPLYIDDTPSLSIMEFSSKAKLYKMKYGIELIIVDYIQLMRGDKTGTRDNEIGSITRGLKMVAKSLNIPIIALAQLSRETEKRGNKRPQLSDLRESGNIEQDADMVIFIHRPEKYGETTITTSDGEISTSGLIDLIISKYRNGSTGDVFLWTDESFNNLREENEIVIQEISFTNIDHTIEPNREFEKDTPF